MAAPRLPFLYPNLLRSVRACEPTTYRSIRFPPPPQQASHQKSSSLFSAFHTSQLCDAEPFHQRYGPAAEPRIPPPPKPKDVVSPEAQQNTPKKEQTQADRQRKMSKPSEPQDVKDTGKEAKSDAGSKKSSPSSSAVSASSTNISAELPSQGSRDSAQKAGIEAAASPDSTAEERKVDLLKGPQDFVFQMPGPISSSSPEVEAPSQSLPPENSQQQKPPHLSPRPYVHHFDTYTLVKDLGRSGFTEEQSVSIMKAIRGLLADNLELARKGLISKSDVENETYLFQAACSELRNSVQASRNTAIQAQRSERAQLQHELDILTQRMTQELAGLKDDLKEMFNDQKISTRELQRSLDTAIQELNYQITVSLNSDGKSEVEGLRWILTRRAALAIATSASMIILALRYSSYKHREKENAAKGAAAEVKLNDQPSADPSLPPISSPESMATEPIG
ncbi:hypothetical protein RJZ56_006028 [Blastomyces dermatitidis]|uniref:MOZ protein represents a chromatin-associated acetyltransferase n=3 Tax=Blastomyces TaxID=229219 RepID=A0A179UR11_BLAGS|nr:uncharacterized protein BDBG_05269 [Blastomyces gilchristii SLH14081]XP_045278088.1 uncharacterized protein BDCG_06699 [Blastomyces dermatitidis ER-3]EGE84413.1 MOZ protein represents a chromatin-associated acetyltransferase [Blastomyces dermatitidis ATCC 18188]EQL33854.1 hypothetical protein BDFG_04237 [Blastomyces dermatitidis ATCC 26199]EEQ91579.1 hypothetical protein BDCG_06699 [Blastomyces dermatitidis ER-3]OAT09507.1 hypothetical protein BDBG_05269 [Blastomyces gilchristii SLH14081]